MTIYETQRDLVAEYDALREQLEEADDRKPALELARRLVRLAERLVEAAPGDADAQGPAASAADKKSPTHQAVIMPVAVPASISVDVIPRHARSDMPHDDRRI